jgi:hypothetical protein
MRYGKCLALSCLAKADGQPIKELAEGIFTVSRRPRAHSRLRLAAKAVAGAFGCLQTIFLLTISTSGAEQHC